MDADYQDGVVTGVLAGLGLAALIVGCGFWARGFPFWPGAAAAFPGFACLLRAARRYVSRYRIGQATARDKGGDDDGTPGAQP